MYSSKENSKSPSYLFRNPHSYCFRMGVPGDLREIIGKREFRYSLRTGRLSEARRRAHLLSGLLWQLYYKLRSNRASYGRAQVESMVSGFFWFALEGSESLPDTGPISNVSTSGSGPKLKRLVDEYLEENRRSGRWSKRTEKEYRNCFNVFLFYFGNAPIGHISHKTMRGYKEFLLKIPANYSKIEKYRNLSPRQLTKVDDGHRLSVSAINRYLGTVRSFLSFAVKNGYVETNYAAGLQLPPQKRPDEQRAVFSAEDLRMLFHSPQYINGTHRHPYQFWLPLLGLYTGCRIEELCQLHIDDVKQVDGVWVIDINDAGERRLKNQSSRRLVPLHPALTDQFNFPAFVESKSVGRVFSELRKVQHCFSHGPSKWFGRYKRQCGIDAPPGMKTFHSFRHTLVNHLKQKQVPELFISELVGHSVRGETMGRYGKRFSPEVIYREVVLKIEFSIDFSRIAIFQNYDKIFH